MNKTVTPDCPECGGTGRVPFDDDNPHCVEYVDCGACVRRFHESHCPVCHEAMPSPERAYRAERVVRGEVVHTVRVCSYACAVSERAGHGVVDVMPPEVEA
jgi:hypothetical protein